MLEKIEIIRLVDPESEHFGMWVCTFSRHTGKSLFLSKRGKWVAEDGSDEDRKECYFITFSRLSAALHCAGDPF